MKPRKTQRETLSRCPAVWCWNCGEAKDPRDFEPDPRQRDGLARECRHCAEMRAVAARIDAEAGRKPVENGRLDGDRKKRGEWYQERATEATLRRQAKARRRCPSGPQPAEGWEAVWEGWEAR